MNSSLSSGNSLKPEMKGFEEPSQSTDFSCEETFRREYCILGGPVKKWVGLFFLEKKKTSSCLNGHLATIST